MIDQRLIAEQRIPIRWFGKREGLESGQVHNVAQDLNGLIWLSGPSGLSRYDGSAIRNFTRNFALTTHGLRQVICGFDGHLYVATDMGIDVVIDGTCNPISLEWLYGAISDIVATRIGIVFSTVQGIYLHDGSQVSELQQGNFGRLFVDRDETVWCCRQTVGAVRIDTGSMRFSEVSSVSGERCQFVAAGIDDQILIGTTDKLLQLTQDGTAQQELPIPGVSAAIMTASEVWIVSEDRLIRYTVRDLEWCQPMVYLDQAVINHLFEDRDGNIWGATDSRGLFKISSLRALICQPEFDAEHSVFFINKLGDKGYEFGGKHIRFQGHLDNIRLYQPRSVYTQANVWDLLSLSDRECLIATDNGLYLSENEQWNKFCPDSLYQHSQCRILLKRSRQIWAGSRLGLTLITEGNHTDITSVEGESLGYVYCMALDQDDHLWVGTIDNGLWVESDRGFVRHRLRFIANKCSVYSIDINDDNEAAVLHGNQISIHSDRHGSTLVAKTDAMVSGWSVRWDDDGRRLWVGGTNGLNEYDVSTCRRVRRVDAFLGNESWEFTTSKSLQLINDTHILCGLNSGFCVVDKNKLEHFTDRPICQLDEVNWSNAKVRNTEDRIKVAPGKWTLQIQYFSAWYISADSLCFRYKLIGFDDDWTITRQSEALYTSLPVGLYKFEIQAYSPISGWGQSRILMMFEVTMPWWTRGWLTGLLTVFEQSYGFIASRLRNRDLIRQNSELEATLQERTFELENAYQQLHQINQELATLADTDPLTGLANRRALDRMMDKLSDRLTTHQQPISLLLIDIDDFKQLNDNFGHDMGDLILVRLAQVLGLCSRKNDLASRFGGEEFAILLPDTEHAQARKIAEKLLTRIREIDTSDFKALDRVRISASIGICVSSDLPDDARKSSGLIKYADRALYRAKKSGKDRVEFWTGNQTS